MFFFQAEDGIRDLVRSRGLGDVYKRQNITGSARFRKLIQAQDYSAALTVARQQVEAGAQAVSYTHLTLPTSDLV